MAVTNDHFEKDLYSALGVGREATPDEIKQQYQSMASKFHPDRAPEGPAREAAEARFKEMKAAYETLSDPAQRADYDQGRAKYEQSRSGRGPSSPSPKAESTGGTGSGLTAEAHSRKWGLKGWGVKGLVVGGALAAWGAVEAYYAVKKFTAPSLPTPAAVIAAHKPSDPAAPGSVFMTRLQMDMTHPSTRSSLQNQLGIPEHEAARIQKVFMNVRDVNNPNAETPYDKIAKAMKSDKDSVKVNHLLKDGRPVEIRVDGGQVSIAIFVGDTKQTKSEIVFPHSDSVKAAFAPDRRAADLKSLDAYAGRVSGKAINYPLSPGAATAFIGNSVWNQYSAFERQMAPPDPTKGVFDDSTQFSEFWRKVLRDKAMLETGFSAKGDVKQEYKLADGTKASIHITPENVEFERVDPGTGNKRSFKQETAISDRLSLSEPSSPTATRSIGAKPPSPG